MSFIKIEYAGFAKGLNRLPQICLLIFDEVGKIADYTANCDIFWDGDVNAAYNASLGQDLIEMGLIAKRIRQAANDLIAAYEIYARTERDILRITEGGGI